MWCTLPSVSSLDRGKTSVQVASTASASDDFRAECDRIWQGLNEHPFITELAAGSLPIDKFRFFLEQDIFYLE